MATRAPESPPLEEELEEAEDADGVGVDEEDDDDLGMSTGARGVSRGESSAGGFLVAVRPEVPELPELPELAEPDEPLSEEPELDEPLDLSFGVAWRVVWVPPALPLVELPEPLL